MKLDAASVTNTTTNAELADCAQFTPPTTPPAEDALIALSAQYYSGAASTLRQELRQHLAGNSQAFVQLLNDNTEKLGVVEQVDLIRSAVATLNMTAQARLDLATIARNLNLNLVVEPERKSTAATLVHLLCELTDDGVSSVIPKEYRDADVLLSALCSFVRVELSRESPSEQRIIRLSNVLRGIVTVGVFKPEKAVQRLLQIVGDEAQEDSFRQGAAVAIRQFSRGSITEDTLNQLSVFAEKFNKDPNRQSLVHAVLMTLKEFSQERYETVMRRIYPLSRQVTDWLELILPW